MKTLIHQRVEAAQNGTNPTVICRVRSGWIVLGDWQFFRGYSLLLADPVVPSLNALSRSDQMQFLQDMAVLGEALLEVTNAQRINYEILGNAEPALHAHLFPRYSHEPEHLSQRPVWSYPSSLRNSVPFDRERDRLWMEEIAAAVQRHGS